LIDLFKYYANISELSSYTYISYTGFLKFAKDINILISSDNEETVFSFPFNLHIKPTLDHKKRVDKGGKFQNCQLNSIFSKFSSEVPLEQSNMNKNKLMFKKVITVFSSMSNRRINFKEFIKILLCLSYSLLNSSNKSNNSVSERENTHNSQNSNNENKANQTNKSKLNKNQYTKLFLNIHELYLQDISLLQGIIENFINTYVKPIHNSIKAYLEKYLYDTRINDKILEESNNIEEILKKMRPIIKKIFYSYSIDRINLNFDQFMKFAKDFDIFPDLLSRPKLFHLFINFVEDFDEFIVCGNHTFNIDIDKFNGLLMFCAVESNFITEGNDYFRKVIYYFKYKLILIY